MNRRIALTGGIACGKSLLSRFLREEGVETIDADDIVHELIPDPAERRRIATEVFADPAKRRALEARLHPLVRERIRRFVDSSDSSIQGIRIAKAKNPQIAEAKNRQIDESTNRRILRVAIIPLLFEVHWESDYDIICSVVSSRAEQIARMMSTRGYTREEAEARLAAQMPVEEKASRSHYVIRNDGSAEELRSEAAKFVAWLKEKIKDE